MKEQAAEKVAEVSRHLLDEGEKLLSKQKLRAASGLQDIGTSIQEAAGRFQTGPLEPVGPYVEAAAEQVSRASEYLAEQDVAAVLKDAETVVLRRPQLFLGGMFLTGLVLARFLKATGSSPAANRRSRGHQPESRTRAQRQTR